MILKFKSEVKEVEQMRVAKGKLIKLDLAKELAKELGISKAQAKRLLDKAAELIFKALKEGKEVHLSPLGVLGLSRKSPKPYVDPRTGERKVAPAKTVPVLRASKKLKEAVKDVEP